MQLRSGARLGVYEIAGLVGAGGMGEVYRARDTRLNRQVALKILPESFALDPERLARFKREARSNSGNCGVHGTGAGARARRGQARRHLGVRLRAVRDVDGTAGVSR